MDLIYVEPRLRPGGEDDPFPGRDLNPSIGEGGQVGPAQIDQFLVDVDQGRTIDRVLEDIAQGTAVGAAGDQSTLAVQPTVSGDGWTKHFVVVELVGLRGLDEAVPAQHPAQSLVLKDLHRLEPGPPPVQALLDLQALLDIGVQCLGEPAAAAGSHNASARAGF